MSIKHKTLVEVWQETYPKVRPWVAIILVVAFLLSVLFYDEYKIGIISALAGNLVFLIFDLTRTIKVRLDKIDADVLNNFKEIDRNVKNLSEPQPPTYVDFNLALPVIRGVISEKLKYEQEVHIRILAVSAQFSWKNLIESSIPPLLAKSNAKSKLIIELAIVSPDILHNWGQKKLENDAISTRMGAELFIKQYKKDFVNNKMSLSIYQYDNMPHWHGILIDEDVLFMGRCKWEKLDGRYHLMVGQIDYRQFKLNDRFGGSARIELHKSWFDAYKYRATKTDHSQILSTNN